MIANIRQDEVSTRPVTSSEKRQARSHWMMGNSAPAAARSHIPARCIAAVNAATTEST